ncbi:MAG: TetR/AcrR family transcriptional regulator [Flavobacteriaceae bacterium]|jgi:AcrR family transcriptional regulator|nr:TetR/AcrR family transcriptional regulator [Flavobacteriaceae bacterium]
METQILDKATEMFMAQGFKTVTMDDIANDLSISKKTIYQHFASKPDLIEKCLAHINSIFLKQLEESLSKNEEAIPEMFRAYTDINKIFVIDCSSSFYQLSKYYPKIAQKQKAFHQKKYVKLIEKNLKKGIKEGVYRSDLDVEFVARFYIASYTTIEDLDFFPKNMYTHLEVHAMHSEYHFRSIATEKGLKKYYELLHKRQ